MSEDWTPKIGKTGKALYIAIADAMADDIAGGMLKDGDQLPPQRSLADRLGMDFSTISRAYAEARRRGLVVGRVGQGTFVKAARQNGQGEGSSANGRRALIDMSMNAPPLPDDPLLIRRLSAGMASAVGALDARMLSAYGDPGGAEPDRAAGRQWLAERMPESDIGTVLVCPGAQGALMAVLSCLARPGHVIAAEALCYPGIRSIAAHLGLELRGLAMDKDGIIPAAFRHQCQTERPQALYCNPTLHNPTGITWSNARRAEIAALAREYGVPIIEDDAYGALPLSGPRPLAHYAPDLTYYIAGLAKCVSPALRIAYLSVPKARQLAPVIAALRGTSLMASPLLTAIATQWIGDGTARMVRDAIRAEAAERMALAVQLLPPGGLNGYPFPGAYAPPFGQPAAPQDPAELPDPVAQGRDGAFHFWLSAPAGWRTGDFAAYLRGAGVLAASGEAFAATSQTPVADGVRLCLGVPASLAETRQMLGDIAALMTGPVPGCLVVV